MSKTRLTNRESAGGHRARGKRAARGSMLHTGPRATDRPFIEIRTCKNCHVTLVYILNVLLGFHQHIYLYK